MHICFLQLMLHPGRWTWNLRIQRWKRNIIFQFTIFRFYVNLRGCRWNYWIWTFLTPSSNSSVDSTAGDARARQGDLSIVHGMEKWKNALNVPRPDSTWDLGFCPSACVCFFLKIIQIDRDHESEIIGSQLKFSFINISIDWGGFILSDFSRLSIRNWSKLTKGGVSSRGAPPPPLLILINLLTPPPPLALTAFRIDQMDWGGGGGPLPPSIPKNLQP